MTYDFNEHWPNNCPFCGSECGVNEFVTDLGHGDFEHSYFVDCKKTTCRATVRQRSNTPAEAVERWNERKGI